MLSHGRFRTPPLLRTDTTQWHTTGQLWLRWFLSLADGARAKEVSSKTKWRESLLLGGHGRAGHLAEQDAGLARELSPQVVKRPLRGPRPDTVAVAK
jgi:hypothetical protein